MKRSVSMSHKSLWACLNLAILGFSAALWVFPIGESIAQEPEAIATCARPEKVRGELVQGGLLLMQGEPGIKVVVTASHRAKETPIPVAQDGSFLLPFHRDEAREVSLSVKKAGCSPVGLSFTIEPQAYQIQRIDGLPPKKVDLPPEIRAKRAAELRRIGAARRAFSTDGGWRELLSWPIENARVSSVYGSQRILNGKPRSPHSGVDLAAPTGTKIKSPADGVVRLAATDFYLEGGIVIIDHGYYLNSTMIHLSEILVEEGQQIKQGDVIGAVGATGRATGPHLHWSLAIGRLRVDPMLVLGPYPLAKETNALSP
ncbi:MAG: M23 family metallopeptidase [Pseudomonadota bacterium]